MNAITDEQAMTIQGYVSVLLGERKKLDTLTKLAANYFDNEIEGDSPWSAEDAASEVVYNAGDDIEEATEQLMQWLGVEVA